MIAGTIFRPMHVEDDGRKRVQSRTGATQTVGVDRSSAAIAKRGRVDHSNAGGGPGGHARLRRSSDTARELIRAARADRRGLRSAAGKRDHEAKKNASHESLIRPFRDRFHRFKRIGGAGGIRTLDTVLPYTHFPGERLRPLGHRSANRWKREPLRAGAARGKVAGHNDRP